MAGLPFDGSAHNAQSEQQHRPAASYGHGPSSADPARFLGPGQGSLSVNPFDKTSFTNYAYPEAVKDSSLRVRDDITGFVLDNSLEWYTTVVLPWAQTDQMSIHWNEWHFDNSLADRVPHEGVSRLITSSKRQFTTHVVRRGLAFVMEGDYADTPEGREQYVQNVRSIAQSVQETQDHDTVWALLTCKNYQKIWTQTFHAQGGNVPFSTIYDEEVLNFGSACEADGEARLQTLIEYHKRLLAKVNVVPDTLIVSPGTRIYFAMHPPERIEYWKAGPDGVRRREVGPTTLGSIQGLNVFETRDFTVYEDDPALQLLTRPIQIAEFYPVVFDRLDSSCFDYSSKEMAAYLYDENDDQFRKVTALDSFDNSMLFDAHGHYSSNVHRYVESLNAERRAPTPMDVEDNSHDPTLFLAAPGADNKWMAIRYFGQMEMHHMSPLHVQRIAESIASGITGQSGFEQWRDFMLLMTDLQSQGYNPVYWTALVGANAASSVDDNGFFIGERTPADLADAWGVAPQVQWIPNEFGSLNLPQGEAMRAVGIPAGYANGPGLRTLAAEASKPNSPWREVGQRAQAGVNLLQTMIEYMRQALPSSVAFDAGMRAPWFHRADALSTFLDGVFGVSGAPLFMLHLPIIDGEGVATPGDDGGAADAPIVGNTAPWFVLPGTVYNLPQGRTLTAADMETLVDAIQRDDPTLAGGSVAVTRTPTNATGNVVFKTASGATVAVPAAAFNNVVRYAPEVRALGALPAGNSEAASAVRNTYVDAMATLVDADDRRALASFVQRFGALNQTRMWAAIAGLAAIRAEQLPAVIQEISLADESSAAQQQAAAARIDALARIVIEADYAGMQPLITEWTSDIATVSAGPGAFGFAAIADDVQTILDIERELLATADPGPATYAAAQAVYTGGTALTPAGAAAFAALVPADGADATRFAQQQATLTATAARVDAVLRTQGTAGPGAAGASAASAAAAERGRTIGGGQAGVPAVTVADDPVSVAGAAYYRTPLTSSRALVESLSSRFANGLAKPLVLPGDRRTAYTEPYAWAGDADSARIPLSSALTEEGNSASFRTLSELFSTHTHALDDTPLVRQLDLAAESGRATLGASAAVRDALSGGEAMMTAASAFGDDDDGAELSALASAGGSSFRSSSQTMAAVMGAKRARMEVGARAGHDDVAMGAFSRARARVRTGAFAMRFDQTSQIADPIVRAAARVFLGSRADHASTWRTMIEKDIIVPANFILARPTIIHDMASFIMMKAGIETGANFFGGANVGKNVDNVSKRVYYNFTFRSKAVVYREKNVRILENQKFEAYRGGHNTQFMRSKRDAASTDQHRPSLVALATSITDNRFGNRLDLAGRTQVAQAGSATAKAYMYMSAVFYDKFVWGFSDTRTSMSRILRADFFERGERMTTVAASGGYFLYNRAQRIYNRFMEPTGHLKRNFAVPGGRAVMSGRGKTFKEFDYHTVHLP